ncbi:hypothetical protein D477_002566 [Arthrobacter crystallopoietes BAB-32]|uniref:Uncharacterized protein n=1 Tax=Arthrobacter crystallopoietes BAB-32 TaxID=1246476 RepID=N1V398_9MICC|nr:SMI1/KNR4 family protein [Arthrobacter crystallopoietes]EMY35785.1 hypothetical protein D477_002566 [Arthrobacter crystallopoietes BAB-32]
MHGSGQASPHADLAALDEKALATAADWYGGTAAIVRNGNWSVFDADNYRMVIKCAAENYVVYDRLYQSNAERRPQYLITADPGTVVRCILYIAAQRYRLRHRLPALPLEDEANRGFSGRITSPADTHPTVIEGSRGGVGYSAAFSFRDAARAFTHYADVPLDELVESLPAPDGRPLFPLGSQPPSLSRPAAPAAVPGARDFLPAPDPAEALPLSGQRSIERLVEHFARLCRAKSGVEAIRFRPPRERPAGTGMEELDALHQLGDGQEQSPEATPLFGRFWYLAESELAGRGEELVQWHRSSPTRNRNDQSSDGRLQPSMFDARWIPFAAATDGEVLAIDTNPGPQGKAGQLVSSGDRIDHEPTYQAPSLTAYLERLIRLFHADCSYWELGDDDDGSQDSLRPMVAYLSRYLHLAGHLPEPPEGADYEQAIAAVVPFLELLGVHPEKTVQGLFVAAGGNGFDWRSGPVDGRTVATVSSDAGAASFLNGTDAARFMLWNVMSALRRAQANESGRRAEQLELPAPLPHEIVRAAGERGLYERYGNQPLREIIACFGLPLFREGQMYRVYEPGD